MKVADKLVEVDNSFTINMYDNGFMVEITGRVVLDEWSTARIVVSTVDELLAVIEEVAKMKRT